MEKRMNVSRKGLWIVCFVTFFVGCSFFAFADAKDKLFPENLPANNWTQFNAAGFSEPVSGIVFDAQRKPCCGVPLGGLGTGCLDIETSGVLGFCSIFQPDTAQFSYKFICERNPQMLKPFLGLSVGGQTWILAEEKYLKGGKLRSCWDIATPFDTAADKRYVDFWDVELPEIKNVQPARNIHYWGHYPVADIEYETDCPVSVGLRAWAPFIPGDCAESGIPAAVFEVHLRNQTSQKQSGVLGFNFPGPEKPETGITDFSRTYANEKNFQAITFNSHRCGYTIAVAGTEEVRFGGDLSIRPDAWSDIHNQLPAPTTEETGASAAINFALEPKQSTVIRIILSWDLKYWRGGSYDDIAGFDIWGENTYTLSRLNNPFDRDRYRPMYSIRFKDSRQVAEYMAAQQQSLLRRVLAWQQAIYSDKKLPGWLQDCLVNNLALFAEDSKWAVPDGKTAAWAYPTGAFQMTESPRRCSIIGCTASNFYGDLPIAYFFPELERMILKGYMANMRPDGAVPFLYPSGDFTKPTYDWQIGLNGSSFVDLVHRLWMRTNDRTVLEEFYPAVKRVTEFTVNLKSGPYGIISFHREGHGQEWWELTPMYGMVTHLAGVRLAHLYMANDMAESMGDKEFASACSQWIDKGHKLTEEYLWNAPADSYLLYFDPEGNRRSELLMSSQLDGQWVADLHGLPAVFQKDRIALTLNKIEKTCMTDVGLTGFDPESMVSLVVGKEGQNTDDYGTFTGEIHIVAMTYMYQGHVELGMEIVRRTMENLVVKQGHGWDLPNMINTKTGARIYGCDYYQNMTLWGVPAAMQTKNLAEASKTDGLVARIISAGAAQ